jgi:thymidylate synthase
MQPGIPMGDFLTQEDFINKIKTDDVFAEKWGSLGKIYGSQWRKWDEDSYGGIDQISQLIRSLRETPDSRRMIVSAWNPTYIPHMVLPPCHYSFQVYTRELSLEERRTYRRSKKNISREIAPASEQMLNNSNIPKRAISLMFNMRSNDVPLGLPFNLASYGLLLEIFGKMVNMVPDELIANLGDAHIYKNQINGVKEQLTREPYSLPKLDIHPGILDYELDKLEVGMFKLVNYKSHPSIKMPLSN